MMLRKITQVSLSKSLYRPIKTQLPSYLNARNEYSVESGAKFKVNPKPSGADLKVSGSNAKPPVGSNGSGLNVTPPVGSGGSGSKKLMLVGVGFLMAGVAIDKGYEHFSGIGIREKYFRKPPVDTIKEFVSDIEGIVDNLVQPEKEERSDRVSSNVEHEEKKEEIEEVQRTAEVDGPSVTSEIDEVPVHLKDLKSESETVSEVTSLLPTVVKDNNVKQESKEDLVHEETSVGETKGVSNGSVALKTERKQEASEEVELQETPSLQHVPEDTPEISLVKEAESSNSLLDSYFLSENDGKNNDRPTQRANIDQMISTSEEHKASVSTSEELKDSSKNNGKLFIDFLEGIHAAEKRQKELDSRIFSKEKRSLEEKHEMEIKDALAKEVMYVQKIDVLEKDLSKEKMRAAAAVKTLQKKAEENLMMELEQKEKETEDRLKKVHDLAKADRLAAIANEKASQIKQLAEADLLLEALHTAFYARSEEAHKNHSAQKLMLGAIALGDALSEGLPIQREVDALRANLKDIDRESVLGLVLSSLPEETLKSGTNTQLQLWEKFEALKRPLRHYSLIPPGGGGILTHTVAHVASGLKVKEDDKSGDGIESVINRVQSFLVEGELAEAAEALKVGVSGTQAEEIVEDWVKSVRNRAVTEQALTVLQSYASILSVTYC